MLKGAFACADASALSIAILAIRVLLLAGSAGALVAAFA